MPGSRPADAKAAPALYLLGGLRLETPFDHGGAGPRLAALETRHHVQAVLAMVGSAPAGVERDHVVDVLWPNSGATAGRNRLYHTVHLARQVLSAAAWDDEWITVRQSRVVLDGRIWCDVQALERAARQDPEGIEDEQLQSLTALCKDEWMPGLDLGDEGDLIRASVRKSRAALMREAIRRLRGQGDTPALRAKLVDLLRLEPTDESLYRESMALDLAAGRFHTVLRTFEHASRALGERLGLKPNAQTRELADSARAHLAAAPSPQRQARPNGLVGREPLIASLVEQLSSRGGVWNLTGLSGVGKTAVVCEVLRRLALRETHGGALVRLGELPDHDSAAAACVRALGLSSYDDRSDGELLSQALRMQRLLLVLDDLDFAGDAQALLQSLPTTMPARVIITSRAPMKLPGSTTVAVPLLDIPTAGVSLEQARQSPSFALFVMRCTLTGSELQSPIWQRDVVRLLKKLDGLPLAIELAAARCAGMTPGEIVEQLENDLDHLGNGPTTTAARNHSMQSSLNWSVRLLSDAARNAYIAASVFTDTMETAQLRGLAMVVSLPEELVDAALDEVLAAGLVTRIGGTAQLRMLHLPRSHARRLAVQAGVWTALVSALLEQVHAQVVMAPLRYESRDYTRNMQHIVRLEDDILSLLEHARIHDEHRFVALAAAVCESWMCRNVAGPVLRWGTVAVQVANHVNDDDAELSLLINLSMALRGAGQFGAAEEQSRAMLPLMERVADAGLVARAARTRCVLLRNVGQQSAAADLCRHTLARLCLSDGKEGYQTLATELMAWDNPERGDIDLPGLRGQLDGSRLWPTLLDTVFALRSFRGDLRELREVADEIVDVSRRAGWNATLLFGIWRQALCAFSDDRLSDGLEKLYAYVAVARASGWAHGISYGTQFLCNVHWREGHMESAMSNLSAMIECDEISGSQTAVVRAPVIKATMLLLGGNALQSLDEMQGIPPACLSHIGSDDLTGWAELGALLAKHFGDMPTAHELAGQMRMFDSCDDQLPFIQRFRNRTFGTDTAPPLLSQKERSAFRAQLCAGITALYAKLPSYRKQASGSKRQ